MTDDDNSRVYAITDYRSNRFIDLKTRMSTFGKETLVMNTAIKQLALLEHVHEDSKFLPKLQEYRNKLKVLASLIHEICDVSPAQPRNYIKFNDNRDATYND